MCVFWHAIESTNHDVLFRVAEVRTIFHRLIAESLCPDLMPMTSSVLSQEIYLFGYGFAARALAC